MIKRKKRCSENIFTDYDGLIEVLLMSRYDKSSSFKKWIDSIPESAFKKCQKYTKKEAQARSNANKINKSSQVSNNVVETGKQRVDSVETKSVEFPKSDTQQVEFSESRVTQPSFKQSSFKQSSSENTKPETSPTPSITPGVSQSVSKPVDAISEYCKIYDYSIDTFLFFLSHVRNMTKERYMEGGMGYMEAVSYLKWIDDFIDIIRDMYKTSPYYLQNPSLAALGEKYKVS